MNYFLGLNRNFLIYTLVTLTAISIFGINFFISFLGNILLLVFLIPVFFLLLLFIGLKSYNPKINQCSNCGEVSLGLNEKCVRCGAYLGNNSNEDKFNKNASESIIEVKAEEIK